MIKRLTKTGNSLALVLDKRLLEQLGIDEETSLELSANGDVLVVTPVRNRTRQRKLKKALEEMDRDYEGVFKRLAE
ncbi:MAG TPA: AbrB/MazE/SpoVT family DNA-binding domain-containing protein [Thermoanaerobaculia bacterium]|jgi:antitoxin component of MazEF toxin-antitoxin module